MGITKYVAPALLCLTATTVAGTATAEPVQAPAQPALQIKGTDHNVGYDVALSADHRAAVSTVQAGHFLATWDGEAVIVTDDDGVLVSTIPLKYDIDGKTAEFAAKIDQDNHRLTLAPVAESDTPVRNIDAQQHFFDVVQANLPAVATGAAIGATIGFIAGFPLGLFVVDFITTPLLAVVGGVIGGAIGLQMSGGQEASDAALNYLDSMVPGTGNVFRPVFAALPTELPALPTLPAN
ncbi:hypothetical protein [Nocardia seriolae]|uniref:DUF8020 domain-containing protein n=1 Tax=Nocardia seriolae TaxID=37332 RepID=A0A0B8N810_9NOCA|nr:hypothetical protein [Nocardia seriolae]APA94128.1 hypothetical protein NS506_00037 [Nocardia seriolae]MTJ60651.1 hypothetical protein [Nocardia seriolae]MTJ73327.1 hypothetical protein [Nocardia seriolae]MTJ84476.1 hypothetical protein [Nocardia seriolae]MTK28463.1 hypothetical protein [Nocardia seriolae]